MEDSVYEAIEVKNTKFGYGLLRNYCCPDVLPVYLLSFPKEAASLLLSRGSLSIGNIRIH